MGERRVGWGSGVVIQEKKPSQGNPDINVWIVSQVE